MLWLKVKFNSLVFQRTRIGELITLLHSMALHFKYSFDEKRLGTDKDKMFYFLTKNYHIVEKALALPAPRFGFAKLKILKIINITEQYVTRYGECEFTLTVRETIRSYSKFHSEANQALEENFQTAINKFIESKTGYGGTKTVSLSNMKNLSLDEYRHFVECRHSIRDFSSSPVDEKLIFAAIDAAKNTPSVCNRQGWHIHYYSEREKINELLSYQNGNAGFTDCIDKLIIVTGVTKAFTRYEHNQLFVDGGLICMNIMLSLHSAGLGTCPLNTCMSFLSEDRLKTLAGIAPYERLIMMVAIGSLKDEFKVACSSKMNIEQSLTIH